jgi:hypothetical protein
MFIELHPKSGNTAVIVGLHHIVTISADANGDGTVIELASGNTLNVSDRYADLRRTLEPR